MDEKKEDSLTKRYGFKLVMNGIILVINAVIQLIVPRFLGPALYGVYSYISIFFTSITSIFDGCTSSAFYSKLSKRQSEHGLVKFYLLFCAILFVLLNLFVIVCFKAGLDINFWQSAPFKYVFLGMLLAYWIWFAHIFASIADAYGQTIIAEILKTIQKLVVVGAIFVSIFFDFFSLELFYLIQIITLIILVAFMPKLFYPKGSSFFHKKHLYKPVVVGYTKEFYYYCKPLVFLTCCTSLLSIVERWLLQAFAGELDQAYFGFANQICVICFIFSSSIMPLLMREFSVLTAKNDDGALAGLYVKTFKLMYGLTAFFSCFVSVNADWVIQISGGNAFLPAVPVLQVMIFYPIHQTLGQINGNMFLAGERTRQYRTVGIVGLFLSISLGIFFLVPSGYGGLGLGAMGLSLKFVCAQLISTNLSTYFNCKFLKIPYKAMLISQLAPIIFFWGIAFLVRVLSGFIASTSIASVLVALFLVGSIYVLCCAGLIFAFPSLLGLDKAFLKNKLNSIIRRGEK